ncbi:MAG TPA: peptidoglycan-binding domain-containing protein, partial [Gemmatimonadota bacterium]|nr:peptidoglycan-binding domain-containing protein [Gemmatimonadota bacterium]
MTPRTSILHRPAAAGLVIGPVLALLASPAAGVAQRVHLPEGTVLQVQTAEALSSRTAREGQSVRTTVTDSLRVEGYTVIPAGSRIIGTVTVVRPADERSSGVLGLDFVRLELPGGSSTAIEGKLTSTDPAERRQIEAQGDARVVLVGGRRGPGAVVGAIGQGRGDDPIGGILGAIGGLLSEGADVTVPAGTSLAVQLERGLVLTARGAPSPTPDAFTIYTSDEMIRAAQEALRDRDYYRGPIDGQLGETTQRALIAFQIDAGILATGNLDGRTARELGLSLRGPLALTADEAGSVRRSAQGLAGRWRDALRISPSGRLDPRRLYDAAEMELYFALSAFADNASLYEQTVRLSGNAAGVEAAGEALMPAAERVDQALSRQEVPSRTQATWEWIREQLAPLEA